MSGTNTDVSYADTKAHSDESCRPVVEILNLVGNKWSVLVVVVLEDGTKRFSELQRSIEGISQRMLTRTLRELERDGLLTRRVEPTVPPSVYYTLTPLGKTLLGPVEALAKWARENYPQIHEAQQKFDKNS